MTSPGRRRRWLAGTVVGGVIVLVDRHRRRLRPVAGGLRAFEDAPCFRAEQTPSPLAHEEHDAERETVAVAPAAD